MLSPRCLRSVRTSIAAKVGRRQALALWVEFAVVLRRGMGRRVLGHLRGRRCGWRGLRWRRSRFDTALVAPESAARDIRFLLRGGDAFNVLDVGREGGDRHKAITDDLLVEEPYVGPDVAEQSPEAIGFADILLKLNGLAEQSRTRVPGCLASVALDATEDLRCGRGSAAHVLRRYSSQRRQCRHRQGGQRRRQPVPWVRPRGSLWLLGEFNIRAVGRSAALGPSTLSERLLHYQPPEQTFNSS